MKKKSEWKNIFLSLDQIETKKSQFNWFPNPLTEKDINSILANGILLPILVYEVKKSIFILVDGFKRVKWIKSSKLYLKNSNLNRKISCLVIPKEFKFIEVAMLRIETLTNQENNFSGFKVCSLLKTLKKKGVSNKEIVESLLPRLGLESSSRLSLQLLKMADIMEGLEQSRSLKYTEFLYSLSSEDLYSLRRFPDKEILSVLNFISIMEVRGKKMRYMVKELNEICRIRGISVQEVLEMREFKEILTKKNIQISERYRLIKEQFNYIRYPQLSNLRDTFFIKREKLNLPKRINLDNDNFFEDEDLTLTLEFNSLKELKGHLKYLEILVDKENSNNYSLWKDIFSLFQ